MHVERSRIRLLTGGAALMLTLVTGIRSRARAEPLPGSPSTRAPPEGAVTRGWDTYASRGTPVKVENVTELRPIKAKYGIPADLEACHTALVGGYVVEGHVPGDVIVRLLRERPGIVGLAVPGMPARIPGDGGARNPSPAVSDPHV